MTGDVYFLEVGIYRVLRERFNKQFDRDLKAHLKPHAVQYEALGLAFTDERQIPIRDHFWRSYVAPWQYNQAVGWLRLLARGSTIRADLWFSDAKRFQRNMTRLQLHLVGKAFEMWCKPGLTSDEISSRLREELIRFQAESRNGRLSLDLEAFDGIRPYVNWVALVK